MRIAILGFAGQGQAAYEYWNRDNNELIICDLKTDIKLPSGAKSQLGADYLKNLDKFDLLVRTPALHPREIVANNPDTPDILDKVTTVTNEFFTVTPTCNIVGVTGTKGKGTTSTLIARMLEAAGKRVHLGGNIGIPPLELLKNKIKPDDWVVLELANFQLIDLKHSPPVAVCLMVVPEHMDWHEDFEEYIAAKQQMFINQEPKDVAIYYAHSPDSLSVAGASMGETIPYMEPPGAIVQADSVIMDGQEICKVSELQLLGKHNLQNVCAAVTATWQVTHDTRAMNKVLTTFSGLEHRLELVTEVGGVRYYDDSFGTTPETAIVAVEAFAEPKVLILGGSDKGASYDNLALAVANGNVRSVITIGKTGPAIAATLKKQKFSAVVDGGKNMKSIVETAHAQAKPGDVVLLSTACASFDMFENYKDRGEQFKTEVLKLA